MIKHFGFRNFFSFKEGGEVSFLFDKRVRDTVPNRNGISYIMGIKGGNGSGKTNIIRGLGFIARFIANSADTSADSKIPIDSFFANKEPSDFVIEFCIDESNYIYELSLDAERVFYEKLSRKLKREVVVFEREGDKIIKCLKSIGEIKKVKLKTNASVISLSNNFNFNSEMEDITSVRSYFNSFVCNVGYSGLSEKFSSLDFRDVSKLYHDNDSIREFMVDFLKSMDSSIADVKIIKSDSESPDEASYLPIFEHKYEGGTSNLVIHDESSGTKVLYKNLAVYWYVIKKGAVLALDEFDIHLHAMMLPKILDLFEDEIKNTQKAQFIFTAHNTEIMDYLGKYRTVLVDKSGVESFCYRLDEIPNEILPNSVLRSDRKISGLYLKKKLGGVPNL
ncbi:MULTISPECIES: AAA family ATPase [unclassified Pseudomonas]|uniref:AAA family ATPase n=1 Tax=unclassified Pseudomonas TaxID=196821 RepID=UPI0006CD210D|nr:MULTISPECIES: ATP-binding protein [unclassified Pseudomonas]KPG78923.1 hypothetical protein AEQ63_23900 [Pseudomonas sp. RIT-PI-o]KPG94530.1 hypothetical protein AK821_19490 [Pseudomonas sp. RIT-PI-r]